MKVLIPPEKHKIFERLPRKDRSPIAEIAAVQSFKLLTWATATGGIYLLKERSGVAGLSIIPYLLWLLIVWDMNAKLGWEPEVERSDGNIVNVICPSGVIRASPLSVFIKNIISIFLISIFLFKKNGKKEK